MLTYALIIRSKKVLLDITENGVLNMEDPLVQFCVSYYSIHLCSVGLQKFVRAWNEHPLPGYLVILFLDVH